MPQLKFVSTVQGENSIELQDPIITIGRGINNAICIEDGNISKYHVLLVKDEAIYKIYDLHSRNGTTVNGQRITSVSLKGGDQVRIGDLELIYETPELAPAPVPAPAPVKQTPPATIKPPEVKLPTPPPAPPAPAPVKEAPRAEVKPPEIKPPAPAPVPVAKPPVVPTPPIQPSAPPKTGFVRPLPPSVLKAANEPAPIVPAPAPVAPAAPAVPAVPATTPAPAAPTQTPPATPLGAPKTLGSPKPLGGPKKFGAPPSGGNLKFRIKP